MDTEYDVIILGGGPAGKATAVQAADGGLSVALVESGLIGGECPYVGCMPSKALLRPAQVLAEVDRVPGASAGDGGIDIEAALARRDEATYQATMLAFDEAIGLSRLRVFHLNDSKKGLGARVDRHTHIGDGELGAEPFRLLLTDERFRDHPGILETPKDSDDDDRRNMATLRSLAGCAPA